MTATDERDIRATRNTWHGYLAGDTIDVIVDRIRRLIGDGQRYTFVSDNTSMPSSMPEVRTSQRVTPESATGGDAIIKHTDGYFGFTVVDTYGVWGTHSSYATEREAGVAAQDPKAHVTYVVIEGFGDGYRDRIEIRQLNGCGETLRWVIALDQDPIRQAPRKPYAWPKYDSDGADAAEAILADAPDHVRWAALQWLDRSMASQTTADGQLNVLAGLLAGLDEKVRPWAYEITEEAP